MVAWKAVALTTVAVVALSRAAFAADLLPPPPAMEPPPPPVLTADLGGWYLRGDVGVGFNNNNVDASTSPNPLNGTPAGSSDNWYNTAISEAALFDVGVGYQVNNWFRADVTGELRGGSSFSGLEVLNVNTGGANAPQYADFYRGNLSTVLGMVNGYFNLGTWYSVSPFVGAGVGVAFNHFYGGTDNGVISPTGAGTSPSGGILTSNTQADLAWALMAGFDVDVTRHLKLELGYRYLNYGKFKSGQSQCLSGNGAIGSFNTTNCGGGFTIASKTLSSNDFRFGLRYYFDSEQPAPEPAPLVRKY